MLSPSEQQSENSADEDHPEGWSETLAEAVPEPAKHSLRVTEDHFAKAVQNPVQQPAVWPRTGPQATLPAHEKTPVLQGFTAGCEVMHTCQVEDRGLEPLTFWLPARRSPN